ncbi:MAG: T9SS type A sorting domain-containing protein [Bacteroidales bacterium]|nr:T9SS type A sorting domain-containing protein [Bacteroidales bacterium]
MKSITRLLFVFTFLVQIQSLTGQTVDLKTLYESRSEIYFRVKFNSVKELAEIDKLVYVDKIENQHCIAYASKIQFSALINAGYQAELLVPPSMQTTDLKMTSNVLRETFEWDSYPTYSAFVAMMNSFQSDYPALCSIHSIATLQSGHQLLVAQINNGTSAGKPQFLYSSTIHGDETTGYILTLRLIDYLLSNYGTNDEVTNIVDNTDIWICPLANPDGTYYFNDNTVNGATRGNANGVDLNRNYPDPEDGAHPDGNFYQPETVAFMNLANENNFTMAANYHGGAEVLNYPWDTWVRRHADDDWWIFVSREYADTVHANSQSGYMTDLNNGITNGYDWYSISGGRQDYMNFFRHCREVTIEVSAAKTLPANQLQAHWNYNYRSMLNYMEESVFGFTGTVIDSITRQPIIARVELLGHDVDSSLVYSSLPLGDYHRPVKNGTYDIVFSATGYSPKTISNVQIDNYQIITNNIELVPGSIIADFEASATSLNRDGIIDFFDRSFGQNIISWNWYFEGAVPSTSTIQNPTGITYPEVGDYDVQLTITNSDGQTDVILIEDYIHVNLNFVMQNGTIVTCDGLFFDSGGQNSDYGDNQNLLLSFIPDSAEHLMSLQFTAFDVEQDANCNYDWMKIYDGLSTDSQLIGEWCGINTPGLVKATNVDGALTINFHSDESEHGTGWSAVVSCIPTVSVNELTADVISIYPNPASDVNTMLESIEPMYQISLIDVQGKIIKEELLGGLKIHSLKTGNLVPGIYFIRIRTSRSTMVKQLVIL